MTGNWNYPTPIRFGAGRISELAEACAELNIRRPLLVTDPDLVSLPPVEEAESALRLAGLPQFVLDFYSFDQMLGVRDR